MFITIAVRPESEKDKKEIERKLCEALASTPLNKHMNGYELKAFSSVKEMVDYYFPMHTCKGELAARIRGKVTIGDV